MQSRLNMITWARDFRKNLTLIELSRSLGDLGTLLNIIIFLSLTQQISLSASLVFGGIWNIANGLFLNIPICVQPMEAIAASALTSKLSIEEVMSAGFFVSVCVCVVLFGCTRTVTLVSKIFPNSVTKGIQVGAGLRLVIKSINLVVDSKAVWYDPSWVWSNNYELAVLALLFIFIFFNKRKVPTAFILFLIGLIFSFIITILNSTPGPIFNLFAPKVIVRSPTDLKNGILSAGLGQLPLTILNSVIALSALTNDLYPENVRSLSQNSICVGLMNMIGCWFGSMPYYHSSGELAERYRFGARSSVSVIILGLAKLLIGLFLGDSLISTISNIPPVILGAMLFVCGVELVQAGRKFSLSSDKTQQSQDFTIMIITTGLLVAYSSDVIGFLGGMVVAYTFSLMKFIENIRSSKST